MLGGVSWVGYLLYDHISPARVGAPSWSSDDEKIVRAVRVRRQVHLAQIPWTLDVANPEELMVGGAALPWRERPSPGPEGAGAVALGSAQLPAFPRRVAADEPIELSLASANLPRFHRRLAVDEPIETALASAAVPWNARQLGKDAVPISLAQLPHLKRIPDPNKPDSVRLNDSRVPWVRSIDVAEPVMLAQAAIPVIKPVFADVNRIP